MDENVRKNCVEIVRRLMIFRDLNRVQLAKAAHISPASLTELLDGTRKRNLRDSFFNLFKALGADANSCMLAAMADRPELASHPAFFHQAWPMYYLCARNEPTMISAPSPHTLKTFCDAMHRLIRHTEDPRHWTSAQHLYVTEVTVSAQKESRLQWLGI